MPEDEATFQKVVGEYTARGLPGCVGSVDCVFRQSHTKSFAHHVSLCSRCLVDTPVQEMISISLEPTSR